MSELDLTPIIQRWLAQCGSCDAGLPMPCTHPDADYRFPMLQLVQEIQRLRAELAEARRP